MFTKAYPLFSWGVGGHSSGCAFELCEKPLQITQRSEANKEVRK